MLPLYSKAPRFSLNDIHGNPFDIRQFEDKKNVVLVFYPFDWSPVCADQVSLYSEMTALFDKRDSVVAGVSTDSHFCHAAFSRDRNLRFPLLADFEPKGRVARLFGAYNEAGGHCNRALFLLDKNQTIVWSYLADNAENPGADGILQALDILIANTEL